MAFLLEIFFCKINKNLTFFFKNTKNSGFKIQTENYALKTNWNTGFKKNKMLSFEKSQKYVKLFQVFWDRSW